MISWFHRGRGASNRPKERRLAFMALEERAMLSSLDYAVPTTGGGSETLVNETVAGAQGQPGGYASASKKGIAADSSGNYVVVWQGNGPGDSDGVFGRLFWADGTPRTPEFRANTTTAGNQVNPVVAMAPS